jgi:hypothetical protein
MSRSLPSTIPMERQTNERSSDHLHSSSTRRLESTLEGRAWSTTRGEPDEAHSTAGRYRCGVSRSRFHPSSVCEVQSLNRCGRICNSSLFSPRSAADCEVLTVGSPSRCSASLCHLQTMDHQPSMCIWMRVGGWIHRSRQVSKLDCRFSLSFCKNFYSATAFILWT